MPKLPDDIIQPSKTTLVVGQSAQERLYAISQMLSPVNECVCIVSRRKYGDYLRSYINHDSRMTTALLNPLHNSADQQLIMHDALFYATPDSNCDAVIIDNAAELMPIDLASPTIQALKNSGVAVVVGCDSLSVLNSSYGFAVERVFDTLVLVGPTEDSYASNAACLMASAAIDDEADFRIVAEEPARIAHLSDSEAFVAHEGRGMVFNLCDLALSVPSLSKAAVAHG